jgi:hypothetical protein
MPAKPRLFDGHRFLIAAYFSTADFARQHPEVIQKFCGGDVSSRAVG